MAEEARIEKFAPGELSKLRSALVRPKVDSWQAADIVTNFLAGRGYGVNTNAMRTAVPRLGGSPEVMQSVLETVAYVM